MIDARRMIFQSGRKTKKKSVEDSCRTFLGGTRKVIGMCEKVGRIFVARLIFFRNQRNKGILFLVSFDSHSILDILFGTHGHSDGHPGPSKKTIPSIQVGIRRFMLRSSKVASI